MADKQDGILILHDYCEEQTGTKEIYLMEYALDGRAFKVGAKRKELWGIFTRANRDEPLQIYTTTSTKGEETITYISDVVPLSKIINDKITFNAIKDLLHRVLSQQDNERFRSQVISYAKDLRIAGQADEEGMYREAQRMFEFVKGDSYGENKSKDDEITKDE